MPNYNISTNSSHHEIVSALKVLIAAQGWKARFEKAVSDAYNSGATDMANIKTLDDYYNFLDYLVNWVPKEDTRGDVVYNMICTMYFVLDQPSVVELQSPISPASGPSFKPLPLTPLSEWLIQYANAMGKFMDTPESLTPESLQSFYNSPAYHMDDYGKQDWKTFNEFFAREVLPGKRPIDEPNNSAVIVSAADSTFDGYWPVDPKFNTVTFTIKGLPYNINELLQDSQYKDVFAGGIFMHAFLNTTDYHRQHAPIAGTVREARVIQGQCYLQVKAIQDSDGKMRTKPIRKMNPEALDAPDDPGYQFCQTRGLIVIEADDPKVGLVAVLPIGMAQVSSVVLSPNVLVTDPNNPPKVNKGDEISHFQFGGSDIVLVFQPGANIKMTAVVGTHYNVGKQIAVAQAAE